MERIIRELREKNIPEEKIKEVQKSYEIAKYIHQDQYRQSGEPYIIHPIAVAHNLLDMEVYDPDTISAALLHDTIEDAEVDFRKEDIATIINPEVAELVDGVTNMRSLNFSTKKEEGLANTRKIINGLNRDVRIIIIKLCDRLHNMRTLEYKIPEKQRENAVETMELFVPLSIAIGAYDIKTKLEDLSLQYIEPEAYKMIKEEKEKLGKKEEPYLREVKEKLKDILNEKNISNDIILRTKNVCTTYKKLKQGYKLENIYDLFYLKILVNGIDDCFQTLAVVHENYPPINGRFKDYIFNPRTNLYQSLHTTVSNSNDKLMKVKIRTFDMDKVSAYGIPALWNIHNPKTKEETQNMIVEKCQFAKKLMELDESFKNNEEFINEIENELLTEHVYPYTHSGEAIELPYGSTALDFAVQVFPEELDRMTGILVNGKEVPLDYALRNKDRVQIITTGKINHENWEDYANTYMAKQKIKKLTEQKN